MGHSVNVLRRHRFSPKMASLYETSTKFYSMETSSHSELLDCSIQRLERLMFDSNIKELAFPNGVDDSSFPTSSFPREDELAHKLAAQLLFLEKRREIENENFGQIRSVQSSSSHQQYWGEDYVNQTYRSANPRFKTEICRNFKEKGTCLYGDLCQFAHGSHELRPDVVRHSKYKTKLCHKYWIVGYCAYGPRCNFIHQEIEKEKFQGGSVTGSSMDTVAKNRAINPSPMTMTMETAAQ